MALGSNNGVYQGTRKGERNFPNFAQPNLLLKLSITLIIDFERYWCLFMLSLNSLVNALTQWLLNKHQLYLIIGFERYWCLLVLSGSVGVY